MLAAQTYRQRRTRLCEQLDHGLVLLPGHDFSARNYAGNDYEFRQDSSFLYFIGLNQPGLAAVIDLDAGSTCVFGDDLTMEDIVFTGPQPSVAQSCEQVGVSLSRPRQDLASVLQEARRQDRAIHYLPQYRPQQILDLQVWLGLEPGAVVQGVSEPLIRAVVAQRSIKTAEEIEQIEAAVEISRDVHIEAMRLSQPGRVEREVVGPVEGMVRARGAQLAFTTIFSVHGETLHNHGYDHCMQAGDIIVHDSGAESALHYCSDISRTIPVSGCFTAQQADVYTVVLKAQEAAMAAVRPGVEFRSVHRLACVILLAGLKDLGLMKGDPEQAVEAGVHTLFFQCGLGHMLGLDVHDMEGLGEDYVGYTDTIRRKTDFGWRWLRLAKALEPGYVITVEPGLYFIPELIDRWQAENRAADFVNYHKLEPFRTFGGMRVEDDVLVTENGWRVLGPHIPKAISEVEAVASS
jgi:Xaa-Pro aminopeptidase